MNENRIGWIVLKLAKLYRTLIGIVLVTYVVILIYWMFFGFSRTRSEIYMYNLTPFSTIKNYFLYYDHFPFSIWIMNIVGNIGVFFPFGILLPLVFPSLTRWIKFTFTFIVSITTIEFFQLISKLGSFDVDDIILNTIGALLGFSFYKTKKRR